MKILEVMTEHTGPFKILVEVLKEMLQEANIEFIMDRPNKTILEKKKAADSDDEESDVDEDEDDDEEIEDEDLSDSELSSTDETDETEVTEVIEVPKATKKTTKKSKNVSPPTPPAPSPPKKKDKSGMRITAIDMTQTVLINLKLDAKQFSTFKCKKQKITLGVNLGYLHKLIKSLDKEDNLTLYQEHDNKNVLKIKVDNQENRKETEFDLKLMELKKEKMKIPDVEFEAVVTMNSSEFHKLCREMNQIADYVDIRCLKNRIEFTCKGEIANRKTVYKTDSDDKCGSKVHIGRPKFDDGKPFIVQGIYELKNLVMFGKCGTLCNDIEIYLKNNYPLVIKYTVATLGRLFLCLSPVKEDMIRNANYEDEDDLYSDEDINAL